MKRLIAILGVAVLYPLAALWAQLAPPNDAGVSLSHWHTIVRSVNESKKFWMTMGGKPIKIDGTEVIKFPGVLVFLTPGTPQGGSFGSVVNHLGFAVPNDHDAITKWHAAGINAEYAQSVFTGGYLGWAYTPDDVKIEINSDKSITGPVGIPHVHIWVVQSAMPDVQAWYIKIFGGKPAPGTNGLRVNGIPGVSLIVANSQDPKGASPRSVGLIHGVLPTVDSPVVTALAKPPVPTKGRSLDHIGFEVKDLEAFCKKLETNGVKFDQPYSKTRHKSFASAELTDPWGVSIELTEGLNKF